MSIATASADAAIERFIRRTDALITLDDRQGRATARELLETLLAADREMANRLRTWNSAMGGDDLRFSEASLVAYRHQLAIVTEMVRQRLEGITNDAALRAARRSAQRLESLHSSLEQSFRGIVRPLRIDEAVVMRTQPSLLARHATSVDRYGAAMIRDIETELSQGFVEGLSQGEMVDRLASLRGPRGMVSLRAVEIQPGTVVRLDEDFIPDGLFVRRRSWAWRIVRTETAEAQNVVSQTAIEEAARGRDDMRRKILAMMDNRTAADSIAVHGQIRGVNEEFVDGAGRHYLRPPARPNDRETVIPWSTDWQETEHSRSLSRARQEQMIEENEEWARRHQGRMRAIDRATR